ncbi:MAG TPA: OmpA family protein [Bacteroidia bacterium]|nr:OmpA family protein [Bacteroidia bacterium]
MMNPFKSSLTALVSVLLLTASCVPGRMYDDVQAGKAKCDEENKKLRADVSDQKIQLDELKNDNAVMKRDINFLAADTSACGLANRRLTGLYNELTSSYEKLVANDDKLNQNAQDETKKMIRELQLTQEELFRKADSLKKQEQALQETTRQLQQREAKVNELQRILNSKDSAQAALKDNLTKALLGFNNNGLTIVKKQGKVYVSLEEQLLFASGSTVVDPRGEQALKQLAEVLDKNPDVNILIEGHTDNVPIKGGNIKDNWDLSVLRSTSVVRILMKYGKIDPSRLMPAGRGEYMPVDTGNTAEARKKNRRIEIILSPKVDELLNLLDSGTN